MAQTCFFESTKTGFMPPSTHFFTHAAPEPACLAPHIESEIQPVLEEFAAMAARTPREKTAASTAHVRFMKNLHWDFGKKYTMRFPGRLSQEYCHENFAGRLNVAGLSWTGQKPWPDRSRIEVVVKPFGRCASRQPAFGFP